MPKRPPDFLTSYVCWFCARRIVWGDIVRMLRHDPGQPEYEERETYSHHACLRAAACAWVPLTFRGARAGERECGLCGHVIAASRQRTRLTLQRPAGTVKRPSFEEEIVEVHTRCMDAACGCGTVSETGSD